MVEEIKEFRPEFDEFIFGQLGPFDNREIGIVEGWSNHNIAPQTPKTIDGNDERRSIEPLVGRAENRDWTVHVRANGVIAASKGGVVDHNRDRVAALRLHDR